MMPRKFNFDLTLLNLHVDLSSCRKNVDKGEPTDSIRSMRFNIRVQTENIRRTLGQNYSDDYVRRWKVSAFRLSNIRHKIFVQETLRESTRKHLDYAKTYRMQPENVTRCEQEVIFLSIFLSFCRDSNFDVAALAFVSSFFSYIRRVCHPLQEFSKSVHAENIRER